MHIKSVSIQINKAVKMFSDSQRTTPGNSKNEFFLLMSGINDKEMRFCDISTQIEIINNGTYIKDI